jgi:hypothetical protein
VLPQVRFPSGGYRNECAASRSRTMSQDESSVVGLFPDRQARTGRSPCLQRFGIGTTARAYPLEEIKEQAVYGLGHSSHPIQPEGGPFRNPAGPSGCRSPESAALLPTGETVEKIEEGQAPGSVRVGTAEARARFSRSCGR